MTRTKNKTPSQTIKPGATMQRADDTTSKHHGSKWVKEEGSTYIHIKRQTLSGESRLHHIFMTSSYTASSPIHSTSRHNHDTNTLSFPLNSRGNESTRLQRRVDDDRLNVIEHLLNVVLVHGARQMGEDLLVPIVPIVLSLKHLLDVL